VQLLKWPVLGHSTLILGWAPGQQKRLSSSAYSEPRRSHSRGKHKVRHKLGCEDKRRKIFVCHWSCRASAAMEVHRIPQGQYVDALRWLPMPSTVALSLWDADTGYHPSLSLLSSFVPTVPSSSHLLSYHCDARSIRLWSRFWDALMRSVSGARLARFRGLVVLGFRVLQA
jgi:hypothetical protein